MTVNQDLINTPLIIFAGGRGTRIADVSHGLPKPMLMVGKYPIIMWIMKHYSTFGINNFIILSGYRREYISQYFGNLSIQASVVEIRNGNLQAQRTSEEFKSWNITIIDSGLDTPTGERLKYAERFIESQKFFCTYGDSLSNVNLNELMTEHHQSGFLHTLTVAKPQSRYGEVEFDKLTKKVTSFREKPILANTVNVGNFIFSKSIFNDLKVGEMLENEPLSRLIARNQIGAFEHSGFWQPIDTARELLLANDWANSEKIPWINDDPYK
jgi:glucose-1-phosphate cytidylyltransferase